MITITVIAVVLGCPGYRPSGERVDTGLRDAAAGDNLSARFSG
jgi:hypothetical protein